MMERALLDVVFFKKSVLDKPEFYQRCGRFYWDKQTTRANVKVFENLGLIKKQRTKTTTIFYKNY